MYPTIAVNVLSNIHKARIAGDGEIVSAVECRHMMSGLRGSGILGSGVRPFILLECLPMIYFRGEILALARWCIGLNARRI